MTAARTCIVPGTHAVVVQHQGGPGRLDSCGLLAGAGRALRVVALQEARQLRRRSPAQQLHDLAAATQGNMRSVFITQPPNRTHAQLMLKHT